MVNGVTDDAIGFQTTLQLFRLPLLLSYMLSIKTSRLEYLTFVSDRRGAIHRNLAFFLKYDDPPLDQRSCACL
jgi:hypothetical protein